MYLICISTAALPIGYYCVHQSAIRALTWVRVPDRHGNGPTVIASGGYDGLQCLTDIRELGGHVFNRTRGTLPTCLVLKIFRHIPHHRRHQLYYLFTVFGCGRDDRSREYNQVLLVVTEHARKRARTVRPWWARMGKSVPSPVLPLEADDTRCTHRA
jgi:hypothetical protein